MLLRTALNLAVAIAIIIFAALAFRVSELKNQLDVLSNLEARSTAAVNEVAGQLTLVLEFSLYGEDRATTQWQIRYERLTQLLELPAEFDEKFPEVAISHHQTIGKLFHQLKNVRKGLPSTLQKRREQLLLDQLLSHTQGMMNAIQQWDNSIQVRHEKIESQFNIFSLVTPIMVLFVLLLLAGLIKWRVLNPIKRFQEAVESVAKGDISKRAATKTRDELGELSESFDRMAIDMVQKLNLEISERKQSENQLASSNKKLSELLEKIKILKEREKENIYRATVQGTQHIVNNSLNQLQLVKIKMKKNPSTDASVIELLDSIIYETSFLVNSLSSVKEIDEENIKDSFYPK